MADRPLTTGLLGSRHALDFNRFDVSTKELVWDDPVAWLRRLGIEPTGPVEVIDSDITTLTASADKVIRVDGADPFLVNIELQSGHDAGLERTLWYRQVALDHRHNLPVLTILVLLRKGANAPNLDGLYERSLPDGRPTNRYHYQVVRLWNEPVASFLDSSAELVPLASLANISEAELPEVVREMRVRLDPLDNARAGKLWTASFILMGMRFPGELVQRLTEGVLSMKESETYQMIVDEGRVEGLAKGLAKGLAEGRAEGQAREARRIVLRLGTKRFGPPEAATLAAIEAIAALDRLEALADRILDADVLGWDTLLKVD